MKKRLLVIAIILVIIIPCLKALNYSPIINSGLKKTLPELQKEFLNLRFGMLICFGSSNFSDHDWANPNISPKLINPKSLNCKQWADAAASAGMTYGCLTTKHHSGFCIWDTKTTDYNIMNSPFKRDIVKEFAEAFRKKGLKVSLYYSILDIHHNIRPGWVNQHKNKFIKKQLTELLTKYGEINTLLIDGWDSPWSRISYDEISFSEIYKLVKSLQPNCLVIDHNAAKYPSDYLFYSDIKQYEQNAGQLISRKHNNLPAQAGIPINLNWFWKKSSPNEIVKKAEFLVNDNLIPLNQVHCNFLLSVTPNRDGLLDNNVIVELNKIGKIWDHSKLPSNSIVVQKPFTTTNFAKKQRTNSSWAEDIAISDMATDDDFKTCWIPSIYEKKSYLEVIFDKPKSFNTIGIVESDYGKPFEAKTKLKAYKLQYWDGEKWGNINIKEDFNRIRFHHFPLLKASKVRIQIQSCEPQFGIAELLVCKE
ncbi:alpha-L-fucosidase [Arcicella rosea]|uniref:alpha-L-fucosidase n=1 Tax=Arcicella rosea TaxID=502909 RepID=A0A841EK13_9BACT|nr:alpha-L-fucosidase [Arcicella rosea]MBB6002544.1 alpha-L-fucosidase [Arcicella rosea]